jgi:hypothetical protein
MVGVLPHRKSLMRLVNSSSECACRRQRWGIAHGPEVSAGLRVIPTSLDYPCAEQLTPNQAWVAQRLARHRQLNVSERPMHELGRVSISAMERRSATM